MTAGLFLFCLIFWIATMRRDPKPQFAHRAPSYGDRSARYHEPRDVPCNREAVVDDDVPPAYDYSVPAHAVPHPRAQH